MTCHKGKELLPFRRKVQLISQRPESFFDPRMRLGDSILEPLSFYGVRRASSRERLVELLEQVKLTDELLTRYPHQVSGGENPALKPLSGPASGAAASGPRRTTSMLDISVQAQILQILRELKETHGLSYLFITTTGKWRNICVGGYSIFCESCIPYTQMFDIMKSNFLFKVAIDDLRKLHAQQTHRTE